MYIEHHRSGSCRTVRYMHFTMCHLPDEPGIQSTGQDTTFLDFFLYTIYIVDDPFDLRTAEIRVGHQTGLFPDQFPILCRQFICIASHSSVLPYDSIVHRSTCDLVPEHYRFALVVNTDARHIFCRNTALRQCHGHRFHHSLPEFQRIVLYPARFRIVLCVFLVASGYDIPLFVQKQCRCSCRSLIESNIVFLFHNHFLSLLLFFN